MTSEDTPFRSDNNAHEPLRWEDKQRFQKLFTKHAVRSYLFLSLGMGLVAVFLPIALVAVAGYHDHFSISYFYHVTDASRNIFVGSMCAIGVFLVLFHGLSSLENWILNAAGAAAISVAMNPMHVYGGPHASAVEQQCPAVKDAGLFSIHAASATFFFVCLAVAAVVLAKGRVKYIIYPPLRRRFIIAYNLAGFLMVAMPVAVFALHQIDGKSCESPWIFWIECFGIWAFASFWFVKTCEYRLLLRIR
jgi:hypothetical protein